MTLLVERDGEELEISYQPYHQTRYMLGFTMWRITPLHR